MRKLALTIEYDGTDFHGWQIQPSERTVQGVMESALHRILQDEIRLIAAGRTDAGVHASGLVAHFKMASSMSVHRLLRGLNSILPSDITIHTMEEVDDQFHARYSAIGRYYRYRILRQPSPLRHRYAWFVPYKLDVEAMREACRVLIGSHDFTSFCQTAASIDGAQCDIRQIDWQEISDELCLDIEANRFLHHMVRTIVGTAVDIGRGRWSSDRMQYMLEAKDRRMAGLTAPPNGLCLVRVAYENRWAVGSGQ